MHVQSDMQSSASASFGGGPMAMADTGPAGQNRMPIIQAGANGFSSSARSQAKASDAAASGDSKSTWQTLLDNGLTILKTVLGVFESLAAIVANGFAALGGGVSLLDSVRKLVR